MQSQSKPTANPQQQRSPTQPTLLKLDIVQSTKSIRQHGDGQYCSAEGSGNGGLEADGAQEGVDNRVHVDVLVAGNRDAHGAACYAAQRRLCGNREGLPGQSTRRG